MLQLFRITAVHGRCLLVGGASLSKQPPLLSGRCSRGSCLTSGRHETPLPVPFRAVSPCSTLLHLPASCVELNAADLLVRFQQTLLWQRAFVGQQAAHLSWQSSTHVSPTFEQEEGGKLCMIVLFIKVARECGTHISLELERVVGGSKACCRMALAVHQELCRQSIN